MNPPNPFPTRELPDQRRAELRTFLVHEVMRDGRAPARRPAAVAAMTAVAVGALSVGGVVAGVELRGHAPGAGAAGSGQPTATATTASGASADGRPAGKGPGCEGMVQADPPMLDRLRYLADPAPDGFALTQAWGTVLDRDCAAPVTPTPDLYVRPAAAGRPAAVVAVTRTALDSLAGVAPATAAASAVPEGGGLPAPTASATTIDGIAIAPGGLGDRVATFTSGSDQVRIESVGLSNAEVVALAQAARANGGTLSPATTDLLDGWSAPAASPGGPLFDNWYAEYVNAAASTPQPDTDTGLVRIEMSVTTRTIDDVSAEAFARAKGNPGTTIAGHPALVLSGKTGATTCLVELSDTVELRLEIDGAPDGLATAQSFVSHLVEVAANDPRIIAPPTDAQLSASAKASQGS